MFDQFAEMQKLETPVQQFIEIVYPYFKPNKVVTYDSTEIGVYDSIKSRPVNLEDLSSGEKQIFSVFAYILFSPRAKFTVLIDEPELSLSVPWQVNFLMDILKTNKCTQLFAVTHSLFIFDNALEDYVIDVDSLVKFK